MIKSNNVEPDFFKKTCSYIKKICKQPALRNECSIFSFIYILLVIFCCSAALFLVATLFNVLKFMFLDKNITYSVETLDLRPILFSSIATIFIFRAKYFKNLIAKIPSKHILIKIVLTILIILIIFTTFHLLNLNLNTKSVKPFFRRRRLTPLKKLQIKNFNGFNSLMCLLLELTFIITFLIIVVILIDMLKNLWKTIKTKKQKPNLTTE